MTRTPLFSTTTTIVLLAAATSTTMMLSFSSRSPLFASAFSLVPRTGTTSSSSFSFSFSSRCSSALSAKKPKNAYAATIALPKDGGFSQRANAVKREPELQEYWRSIDLYQRLSEQAADKGGERFVLHDGPPYANGDLHIGHALNKLLKDFINRKQILNGKQVHYVPGWDCHGLPIELKVLQSIKNKEERRNLDPVTLRRKATAFAKETVATQSADFERYGVIGDFGKPYLTLHPSFEAAQIDVFGEMFRAGHIFRGRKPVHWSPSSQTALAEAELEYPEGHVSKSVYVGFRVTEPSAALREFCDDDGDLRVAVWTTTPWTMPANRAVAVNPDLDYDVVRRTGGGDRYVVATALKDSLATKLGAEPDGLETLVGLAGADLVGTSYAHPLYPDVVAPVVAGGDYVTTESGTGLVHTAPGHGQEDYLTGLKHGLELFSPVDDYGRFTAEAGDDLAGKPVLGEGNAAVVDKLTANGALIAAEDYEHKYPYDWRTKKPTIFRATDQWFASVEGFRDQALDAVDKVRFVPEAGRNRINSFVSGRGDWCISRQRSWGVPIPVFYDRETGQEVLLNDDTLAHIKSVFAEHGSDAWWTMDEVDLLPDSLKAEASKWKKGTDTMDVWFDSGSSWAGVARGRSELAYPADLYLEGSDQHRGWFQSSLLTSVAAAGQAPYKTVLTHGFVLDEKGYKMSKSLGNVVSPRHVIEGGNNKKKQPAYGADVLRLWVASSDYTNDVCIGDGIVKQTFETYRRLRNTIKYLIGNLGDYDPNENAVPYDELPSLDRWMLGRLSATLKEVDAAADDYQFSRAVSELSRFAAADLSNFYLDVAKDRLYISAVDDARRRSCQTVLDACLIGLSKAVAPILPHLAEDAWQNLPYRELGSVDVTDSVFEGGWPSHLQSFPDHDGGRWDLVRRLRDDVNKVAEVARNDKLIGATLDAEVYVYAPDEADRAVLDGLRHDDDLIHPPVLSNGVDDLRTTLMMSRVIVLDDAEAVRAACEDERYAAVGERTGFTLAVGRAKGRKCGRCWFYHEPAEEDESPYGDICPRCTAAVSSWERRTGQAFVLEQEEKEEAKQEQKKSGDKQPAV